MKRKWKMEGNKKKWVYQRMVVNTWNLLLTSLNKSFLFRQIIDRSHATEQLRKWKTCNDTRSLTYTNIMNIDVMHCRAPFFFLCTNQNFNGFSTADIVCCWHSRCCFLDEWLTAIFFTLCNHFSVKKYTFLPETPLVPRLQ